MKVYLDTSALLKRVVRETESASLRAYLDDLADRRETLMTSRLTDVELRRAMLSGGIPRTKVSRLVDDLLAGIYPVPLSDQVLNAAGAFPPPLRTLDAIHAASASVTSADMVVGYDKRLLAAVQQLGLATVSPGADEPS